MLLSMDNTTLINGSTLKGKKLLLSMDNTTLINGSTLKGEKLAPKKSKFFLLRIDLFIRAILEEKNCSLKELIFSFKSRPIYMGCIVQGSNFFKSKFFPLRVDLLWEAKVKTKELIVYPFTFT